MGNKRLPSTPTDISHEFVIERGNPWQPSFLRRAPWFGLGAMLGALIGNIVAVVVLSVSNNQPTRQWPVQPTVYIAIASATTNIFLHFALTEAVSIAWWRRALKNGTTIADLHRNWEYGQSLWAALNSGRHFSLIALASIIVALVPINGPLLQRASRVQQEHFERIANLSINIAQTLPEGYTGYLSTRGHNLTLLAPPFVRVIPDFNQNSPISIVNGGCTGSCNTKVAGAGLVANCSTSDSPFRLGGDLPDGVSEEEEMKLIRQVVAGADIFGAYFLWPGLYQTPTGLQDLRSWPVMAPGTFNLGVQYKGTQDCMGALVVRNCTFRPATVVYPVSINVKPSSISLAAGTTSDDDDLVNYTAMPPLRDLTVSSTFNISTYGGFYKSLSDTYDSNLRMKYGGATGGYEIFNSGTMSNRYLNASEGLKGLSCGISFRDPTDDLLATVRELMFRTALASANSSILADTQHLDAQESFGTPVYTSSYLFLGLAVMVSMLGWVATLPIFLGWWHLGRKVSLSPIETAKAFRALGLRSGNSNAEAENLLQDIGEREVRYGAMTTLAASGLGNKLQEKARLVIGEPELIRSPELGERFAN